MADFRLSTTLLLTVTCLLVTTVVSVERSITCHGPNTHRLNCERGVIVVLSAVYGRLNREFCSQGIPADQLSNTQCSLAGTSNIVKTRCDGKKTCELDINDVFTSDPCHGIYKYLETNYTCFPAFHVVACERSEVQLQCDVGQVIFVNGADYGRLDKTTCIYRRPARELENTHCSNPTNLVAERCNGKNSCTVSALNSVFGDPCAGTYKYLQVAYICDYN
ncbi:L-rhamnose-binding lectin SML-like [Aulostomus maculatus]